MPEFLYSVSFEHATAPVKTVGGKVKGTAGAAARRAYQDAINHIEGKVHWRSVVIVLEKVQKGPEVDD